MSDGLEVVSLWSDGRMRLCGMVGPLEKDASWTWELWLSWPEGPKSTTLGGGKALNQSTARALLMHDARKWAKDITEAVAKTPKGWEP